MRILKYLKSYFRKNRNAYEIIIGVSLLVYGLYSFLLGFHNFDLAQDIEEIEYLVEIKFGVPFEVVESSKENNYITDLDSVYVDGVFDVLISPFIFIIGGVFLGSGLRGLE